MKFVGPAGLGTESNQSDFVNDLFWSLDEVSIIPFYNSG